MNSVLVHVVGLVQSVGFRPFVYGLAQEMGITGWIKNDPAGVSIHAEGEQVSFFLKAINF